MPKQVNVSFPNDKWIQELQRIARRKSVEQDKDVSYLDLIRGAVKELLTVSGSGDFGHWGW